MNEQQETIMVVDDTPTNLGVLFTALKNAGYKVLLDSNGQSALDTIARLRPDIILLDVMMPNIDGFEVCRQLKANALTRGIPVIFMTALTDSVDEVKGLQLGAADYITKPFKVETVLARISTHLTLRNLQRDLQQRNAALQEALDTIKTLSGLVPICAWCGKQIKNEEGEWVGVESYLKEYHDVEFTHSMCPVCSEQWITEYKSKKE